MPDYLYPGVYVEEVSSGSKPIESVATAIAAIIGNTYGGAENEPVFISSFKDYVDNFGQTAGSADMVGNYVQAFYNNGGGSAYVISANVVKKAKVSLHDTDGKEILEISADDFGKESGDITISLSKKMNETVATEVDAVLLDINSSGTDTQITDLLSVSDFTEKVNENLETVNCNLSASVTAIKDILDLLPEEGAVGGPLELVVTGGADPLSETIASGEIKSPKTTAFEKCITLVEKIDSATMILLPEVSLGPGLTSNSIYASAIAQCEKLMDRMVFIDPPKSEELDANSSIPINSSYTALYYPWIDIGGGNYIAPSAFAAGMWGKTDKRRGVWKAPAGMETGLLGVNRFKYGVNNAEQEGLNPKGINVLRKVNGVPVVWGSRTLASKSDPEWRYVPVRRTFMMVEESIREGIQWAVFEPNSLNLWQALKINIESFLNGLWRAGAFQGATSDQAFFVRCGLGQTMTQGDVDAGRVIVEVGIAPLKPAEFVIIRIQQKVAQV